MLEYNIQVNNGNEALGTTGKTLTVNEAPRLVSLDFLVQELNREVNTIGSKASDTTIAQAVVKAKGEIEKLREQVQNIE